MDELLKHDLEDAYYYLYQPNLCIKLPITGIVESEDGIVLELGSDNCSNITIWREASDIKKVRRPNNILGKFDWCYLIKNEYKEPIGYIANV